MPGKGQIENLQLPSKPAENRNSSGPRNTLPISGLYAKLAQVPLPEEVRIELHLEEGATFGDALAAALFAAAIKGSVPAAHELREAIEGRANQRPKEVAGLIEVHVVYDPPLSKMMPKESDTPNE
jgi:hypothetical protein